MLRFFFFHFNCSVLRLGLSLITRKSCHRCASLTCITWISCITCITCITCIPKKFSPTNFVRYHRFSSIFIDHHCLSLSIIDYHWLSLVIIGYHWLSLIIIDYHFLLFSLIIIDFHLLSLIIWKSKKGELLSVNLKWRDASASKNGTKLSHLLMVRADGSRKLNLWRAVMMMILMMMMMMTQCR